MGLREPLSWSCGVDVLFLPMSLLLALPGLPFVPALALTGCAAWRWRRLRRGPRFVVAACAVFWLAYAVYETVMYFWMQTVIAPIRVDLLLIVPVLYVTGGVLLVTCFATRASKGRME